MTREELHAFVDAYYDKLAVGGRRWFTVRKDLLCIRGRFRLGVPVKAWTELGGQVMQASLKKGASTDKRKITSAKPHSVD